jgi:hypothetical protein
MPLFNRTQRRRVANASMRAYDASLLLQGDTQEPADLAQHLSICCPSPTSEDTEREKHTRRGQYLARQDDWCSLTKDVRTADDARAMTPAGLPIADLLCFGARSDVVAAVEHALIHGTPAADAQLLSGIEALEEMLAEEPGNMVRAVVVAQAHMDIGWAWRGTGATSDVPPRNLEAFEAHFDRAADILRQFGDKHEKSAVFSATLRTLNASGIANNTRLAQEYERLIDLNPGCPGPLRAMGTYLSPRWYGSHDELELEARRTAARTHDVWGAGAYTWVMFDAIPGDMHACKHLDLEFFVEGLSDIMERMPDQHTVNCLAAYCAITHGGRQFEDAQADAHRQAIVDCTDWIVRDHMTELHPLVWAHAAIGFDNAMRIASTCRFAKAGKQRGLRKIADLFKTEIAAGNRIIFTTSGPVADIC